MLISKLTTKECEGFLFCLPLSCFYLWLVVWTQMHDSLVSFAVCYTVAGFNNAAAALCSTIGPFSSSLSRSLSLLIAVFYCSA